MSLKLGFESEVTIHHFIKELINAVCGPVREACLGPEPPFEKPFSKLKKRTEKGNVVLATL